MRTHKCSQFWKTYSFPLLDKILDNAPSLIVSKTKPETLSLSEQRIDQRVSVDLLHEVSKVKAVEKISQEVNSWIARDDLPVNPTIKPIRRFNDLHSEDEDEYLEWVEWIAWHMNKDHVVIMSIPKPKKGDWIPVEADDAISYAYGSVDFQEQQEPFCKYHYKLKKIYEKIQDLAQTHSCLSNKEGRQNTFEKYQNIVDYEFKNEKNKLLDSWSKHSSWMNKEKTFAKIQDLNVKIQKCKMVWMDNAYTT